MCHHTHAYGAQGDPTPPAIPPYATLVFDVKVRWVAEVTKEGGKERKVKGREDDGGGK